MNDEQKNIVLQLNSAPDQKIAGRDFHEHLNVGSVKAFLTLRPKEELDLISCSNPRLFHRRFGFCGTTPVRKQTIEIQNKLDESDWEMRWLRYSGLLAISRHEATLKPTRLMPVSGWIQLSMLSLIFADLLLNIAYSAAPIEKQALGLLITLTLWAGSGWGLYRLYIAPWLTLKKAGVLSK